MSRTNRVINFDINLSKSQKEAYDLIHDDKYRFITVCFSRQSGKSVLMLVLVIEWLMKKGNNIAYICKDNTLGKKQYKELMRVIPKEYIKKSNGTDLTIETVFGSEVNFFSALQGSSLRGQTFTHIINDEFSFFKQQQTDGTSLWNDIISPTFKVRGKKCLFVSTPLGKQNLFYEMYQRGLSDDYPKYASILKNIYSDGFVSEEEIENIKKDYPERTFQQEYLCQWLEDGQTFFIGYADCFDYDKYNEDTYQYIGIDLSGDGSDATILTKVNNDNQVQQYEVRGTLDMKYREIAHIINNTPNLEIVYLEKNGLGAPMINEIKKLVSNKQRLKEWTTTNASKEEIVSNLAVEIANKNIHFKKDDDKLYKELGLFTVTTTKTNKLQFNGNNEHDDRVMSLAIALQAKKDYYSKFTKSFVSVIRI